jgi:hypothetical protein
MDAFEEAIVVLWRYCDLSRVLPCDRLTWQHGQVVTIMPGIRRRAPYPPSPFGRRVRHAEAHLLQFEWVDVR